MHRQSIKPTCFIFMALVGVIFSYEFDNLANLGQQISEQVNRDIAPLRDLGPRISAQVEEGLRPLKNSPYIYNRNIDVGNRISDDVNLKMPKFGNLGQQIQESVYQGLEPVRAIEIVFKMKGGVGGTTIATHLPGGKKFIIQNNQIYVCSGTITENTGECSGNLSPFQINNKQDYCYSKNGYSIINNQICIGADTVSVINNNVVCKSNSETPALLLPINDYNELCKAVSETVEYKYIANQNDPTHVEIPNKNKHVKCNNSQSGVCVFSETHSLPQSRNDIFINGQNVYSNTFY